ncbi:MAG: hypothetical protein LW626_04275 [Verrucomicrobium sp.]|nr:hypothetical protein [Verrucomicrobium sp.]
MSKSVPKPHACNVLSVDGGVRRLHHFSVGKTGVAAPGGYLETPPGKPLPTNLVARDWRLLVRSRLDIAWMPVDAVFLRVVQLPACAPEELAGMIEFQLEKLSPMPPAQVVWTVESVPHRDASQQTALVTIVARSAVEAFVDSLEQGGYQADRIELPGLRRLLAHLPGSGEALRVVLEGSGDRQMAILGWWSGGVLREVSRIRLPAEGAPAHLTAHLHGTAWAGEMDGWLSGLPPVTVVVPGSVPASPSPSAPSPSAPAPALPTRKTGEVAVPELATTELLEALRAWSTGPVEVETSESEPELARRTAEQALRPAAASLIPDEVRLRQRRLYVDSLWVKGLTALAMTYLAGVFVYLAVLTFQRSSVDTLRDETRAMALQYTNTLQLKARVKVLQEQFALRFAALDCWNAVVEKLPEALVAGRDPRRQAALLRGEARDHVAARHLAVVDLRGRAAP